MNRFHCMGSIATSTTTPRDHLGTTKAIRWGPAPEAVTCSLRDPPARWTPISASTGALVTLVTLARTDVPCRVARSVIGDWLTLMETVSGCCGGATTTDS